MKSVTLKIISDNDEESTMTFDCDSIQTETYFDMVNILGYKGTKIVFDIEYNFKYLKENGDSTVPEVEVD